ncbi:hypothetical protein O3P69_003982 [Scylla paramamosain]|uniref:Uncharacterized protein n=1 Tax=Scylla paramamosain TaxID=85552 RepID=A0AAW0UII4_SCYPA
MLCRVCVGNEAEKQTRPRLEPLATPVRGCGCEVVAWPACGRVCGEKERRDEELCLLSEVDVVFIHVCLRPVRVARPRVASGTSSVAARQVGSSGARHLATAAAWHHYHHHRCLFCTSITTCLNTAVPLQLT